MDYVKENQKSFCLFAVDYNKRKEEAKKLASKITEQWNKK